MKNEAPKLTDREKNIRDLHPALKHLLETSGTGWYEFSRRLGYNHVAFLGSEGLTMYTPPSVGPQSPFSDEYDFLRALETGFVVKLEAVQRVSIEGAPKVILAVPNIYTQSRKDDK